MIKKIKYIGLMLLTLILLPLGVHASTEATVKTEQELLDALANTEVSTIKFEADIRTTQKININRDVTIDGNDYIIEYTGTFRDKATGVESDDNTVWHSPLDGSGAIYVMHVYRSTVTIKNITIIGGNRALCVNGGTLTLDGSIYLEDSGFDAIELGHGSNVPAEEISTLIVSDETMIFNTSETDTNKTLYVDNADAKITRIKDSEETTTTLTTGTKLTQYEVGVNIMYAVEDEYPIVDKSYFETIKTNKQNLILGNRDGNSLWMFDGSKITDSTISLNTLITFTELAPTELKADIDKVTVNYKGLSYLNFEHEGKLPGLAELAYRVDTMYDPGTKLFIAHFNETTKKLEKPQEVIVDNDGYILFELSECSTYVLYTSGEATETTPENNTTNIDDTVKNVKTGDINLLLLLSIILATGVSLKVVWNKITVKSN